MRIKILTIVLLIFCSSIMAAATEIMHLEPQFWWVGMKNPQLQIMVHALNIKNSTPVIEYPGIKTDSIVRPENSNYLFIYLNIAKNVKPGKFPIKFMENGNVEATFTYELKDRKVGSADRSSFSSSDIIYLLMPDRFANGNPDNDSQPGVLEKADRSDPNGRHGGDIQGIIDHVDYLKNLGITTVWSTPLMEDNQKDCSYHTYAITDYYKIDPRYGTISDYCSLSDALHKNGLKLIMDVVTNHCGSNHWWMSDLPYYNWVHQFKNFTRSNYHISTTYDPYASEYDKNLNFNGWFDTTMPDLNQDNPHLLKYLTQNTIWWIELANLDGIRIDTYPYNNPRKVAEWAKGVRAEYPRINIVGECWVHSQQEIAYWQSGTKNFDGYNSNIPTVMDFVLHDQFLTALNEDDSWLNGITKFYNHFTLDFAYSNPFNLMVFTENHDTPRFWDVIKGDIRIFKIAYAMLFTMRGIPEVYYGFEILMPGDKNKGDGDIRRDFPGGWKGDARDTFTPEGRTSQENEAFNFVSKLMKWRDENPVIHSGKTTQFIPENNCYVYFRYNSEKTVMVIINNHNTDSRNMDTKRFAERMSGFTSGIDIISGTKITDLNQIAVPAKTAMIIELKK
jgi:neopullulanase